MVPFWGRCTTHFSLFEWALGCSLGVRAFDPWPNGSVRIGDLRVGPGPRRRFSAADGVSPSVPALKAARERRTQAVLL